MKVICIKEPHPDRCSNDAPFSISVIKVGEYYNILGVWPVPNNELWYELEEHIGYLYNSILFAQVSEIDETEMERNYNKELV